MVVERLPSKVREIWIELLLQSPRKIRCSKIPYHHSSGSGRTIGQISHGLRQICNMFGRIPRITQHSESKVILGLSEILPHTWKTCDRFINIIFIHCAVLSSYEPLCVSVFDDIASSPISLLRQIPNHENSLYVCAPYLLVVLGIRLYDKLFIPQFPGDCLCRNILPIFQEHYIRFA